MSFATQVRKTLFEEQGMGVRVVSVPCLELFEAQDEAYRAGVLSLGKPVIRCVHRGRCDEGLAGGFRARGAHLWRGSFRASAPGPALYDFFGLDAVAIAGKIKSYIDKNTAHEV